MIKLRSLLNEIQNSQTYFGIEFVDMTEGKTYGNEKVGIFDRKGSERGMNKGDIESIIIESPERENSYIHYIKNQKSLPPVVINKISGK